MHYHLGIFMSSEASTSVIFLGLPVGKSDRARNGDSFTKSAAREKGLIQEAACTWGAPLLRIETFTSIGISSRFERGIES